MITVIRGSASEPSGQSDATFTGQVWRDRILADQDGVQIGTNFFPPEARTHWHSHPGGQALLIVAGEGFVCADGEEPHLVRTGDTVWTPPNVRHWHGATPHRFLVHTAITINGVTWNEPVDDEQYQTCCAAAGQP